MNNSFSKKQFKNISFAKKSFTLLGKILGKWFLLSQKNLLRFWVKFLGNGFCFRKKSLFFYSLLNKREERKKGFVFQRLVFFFPPLPFCLLVTESGGDKLPAFNNANLLFKISGFGKQTIALGKGFGKQKGAIFGFFFRFSFLRLF